MHGTSTMVLTHIRAYVTGNYIRMGLRALGAMILRMHTRVYHGIMCTGEVVGTDTRTHGMHVCGSPDLDRCTPTHTMYTYAPMYTHTHGMDIECSTWNSASMVRGAYRAYIGEVGMHNRYFSTIAGTILPCYCMRGGTCYESPDMAYADDSISP